MGVVAPGEKKICSNYCNYIPQARFAALPKSLEEQITSKFLEICIVQRRRHETDPPPFFLYLSILAKGNPATSILAQITNCTDLSSSSSSSSEASPVE